MTEMRRISLAIPEDLDKRLLELRKKDCFIRCSYSEIVRKMVYRGIDMEQTVETASGGAD